MNCYESFLAQTIDTGRALSSTELETAISELTKELEYRKKIKREELRQELRGNLQTTISEILHNGFRLSIKNIDKDPCYIYDEIYFQPDDICSIEIE